MIFRDMTQCSTPLPDDCSPAQSPRTLFRSNTEEALKGGPLMKSAINEGNFYPAPYPCLHTGATLCLWNKAQYRKLAKTGISPESVIRWTVLPPLTRLINECGQVSWEPLLSSVCHTALPPPGCNHQLHAIPSVPCSFPLNCRFHFSPTAVLSCFLHSHSSVQGIITRFWAIWQVVFFHWEHQICAKYRVFVTSRIKNYWSFFSLPVFKIVDWFLDPCFLFLSLFLLLLRWDCSSVVVYIIILKGTQV